ncbi:hypothetical protein [Paenibacillus koleovorans]|uniref:hypothetical protein n=1 Tax=Paenibacillus koleovorans TaxID=121608 RepID=UPI0013E3A770|nr:hypothetical protein [Paenibacillus koleovorans]
MMNITVLGAGTMGLGIAGSSHSTGSHRRLQHLLFHAPGIVCEFVGSGRFPPAGLRQSTGCAEQRYSRFIANRLQVGEVYHTRQQNQERVFTAKRRELWVPPNLLGLSRKNQSP